MLLGSRRSPDSTAYTGCARHAVTHRPEWRGKNQQPPTKMPVPAVTVAILSAMAATSGDGGSQWGGTLTMVRGIATDVPINMSTTAGERQRVLYRRRVAVPKYCMC